MHVFHKVLNVVFSLPTNKCNPKVQHQPEFTYTVYMKLFISLSRPAVSNKLPGPVTSSPKTKGGVASRGGATKKQSVRGSSAKHTTSKGTKSVAKATVTSVTTPKLIVSLPIGQSQMPRPPKLIPSVSTKGVNITSDKKPSSIGGKGKGKRMSSSSSSGSSSSGSSNGESGSSDSSDSEEPMDTSEIPPPPPLLVDSAVSMATTMTHPHPVQSPIRIMPPNKLTSLNTIPLLSPSNSSPNITTKLLLSGTKQATPTVGVTPLVSPTPSPATKPSSLVATIGGNPAAVNISAFHVVKQSQDGNKTAKN